MSSWLDSWIEANKLPGHERPGWEPFGNPERRQRKMAKIDALPANLKEVVHEHGWLMVKTFMDNGVTDPKKMRALIHIVLMECSHEYRSRYEVRKR